MRAARSLAPVLLLLGAASAAAWLTPGHRRVAVAAVEALPADFPAFFRAGAATVGHLSVDPDLHKNAGTPELKVREEPEHYIDLERLAGRPLPATRAEYFRLMVELGRQPAEMGYLPYAVIEGAERLALCFAEHRRWPDNPHVRDKCLVYAGLLAHSAADLDQPLHTTIHHDGWALPDGASPFTGIHARVDALVERSPFDAVAAVAELTVAPYADLRRGVLEELAASHARLDATYRLEPDLARDQGFAAPPVVEFACERFRASTLFLARLFATAWELSARLELPDWLRRESSLPEPVRR
jgi:hypothetical protein